MKVEVFINNPEKTIRLFGFSPLNGPPDMTLSLHAVGFHQRNRRLKDIAENFLETKSGAYSFIAEVNFDCYIIENVTSRCIYDNLLGKDLSAEIPRCPKVATTTIQAPVYETHASAMHLSESLPFTEPFDVPQDLDVWMQLIATWPAVNVGLLNLTEDKSHVSDAPGAYPDSNSASAGAILPSKVAPYHHDPSRMVQNPFTSDLQLLQTAKGYNIISKGGHSADIVEPRRELRPNWPLQISGTSIQLSQVNNFQQQGVPASLGDTYVPNIFIPFNLSNPPYGQPSSGQESLPSQPSHHQENTFVRKQPLSHQVWHHQIPLQHQIALRPALLLHANPGNLIPQSQHIVIGHRMPYDSPHFSGIIDTIPYKEPSHDLRHTNPSGCNDALPSEHDYLVDHNVHRLPELLCPQSHQMSTDVSCGISQQICQIHNPCCAETSHSHESEQHFTEVDQGDQLVQFQPVGYPQGVNPAILDRWRRGPYMHPAANVEWQRNFLPTYQELADRSINENSDAETVENVAHVISNLRI